VILKASRGARRALGRRRGVAARGAARTRQPGGGTRTAARRVRVLIEGGAIIRQGRFQAPAGPGSRLRAGRPSPVGIP
jgi:hypothetical protein